MTAATVACQRLAKVKVWKQPVKLFETLAQIARMKATLGMAPGGAEAMCVKKA